MYLEGWAGEEDGRDVQKGGGGGDICMPMADSC